MLPEVSIGVIAQPNRDDGSLRAFEVSQWAGRRGTEAGCNCTGAGGGFGTGITVFGVVDYRLFGGVLCCFVLFGSPLVSSYVFLPSVSVLGYQSRDDPPAQSAFARSLFASRLFILCQRFCATTPALPTMLLRVFFGCVLVAPEDGCRDLFLIQSRCDVAVFG